MATRYESPEGAPDAQHFRGYWFDGSGQLLKFFANGLEVRRSDFVDFDGAAVARRIDILSGGKLGIQISVVSLEPAGPVDEGMFALRGHEYVRQFTAEVR